MMPVSDMLAWTLFTALGAVGLTTLVRNAPIVRGWVMEAKRPWACNVCMPLYTSVAILALPAWLSRDLGYALVFPAAYALANTILDRVGRPLGPPPKLIPEDSEEE
jgi:hypothetical protein